MAKRFCDGIPPNHPAGECPWCDQGDQVNSDLYIENQHRKRDGRVPLAPDDPELARHLYGAAW